MRMHTKIVIYNKSELIPINNIDSFIELFSA